MNYIIGVLIEFNDVLYGLKRWKLQVRTKCSRIHKDWINVYIHMGKVGNMLMEFVVQFSLMGVPAIVGQYMG